MNIVQISNLFNQVCMGINLVTPERIGFYHYGWYSDINSNITNNWTGNNSQGRYYPSVQFMYPTTRVEIKQPSVKGTMDCRMVVARPQYYNNDASYNGQSIIECHAELEALAVNILSEFNRIARGSNYQAGINGAVTIDYLSDAHNENLALLDCSFQIWYVWECPTDTANISALPTCYNDIPPPLHDLEQQLKCHCPMGFTENINIISLATFTGIYWELIANAKNFTNEIIAHPNYVGGIQTIQHNVTDVNGNLVGVQVISGFELNVIQLDPLLTVAIYTFVVNANFNFGQGVQTIQHSLIFQLPFPHIDATYDSNDYTCTEL
jgi:hypothetical protein